MLQRVCDDHFGITSTFAFPSAGELLAADALASTIYSNQIGPEGQL